MAYAERVQRAMCSSHCLISCFTELSSQDTTILAMTVGKNLETDTRMFGRKILHKEKCHHLCLPSGQPHIPCRSLAADMGCFYLQNLKSIISSEASSEGRRYHSQQQKDTIFLVGKHILHLFSIYKVYFQKVSFSTISYQNNPNM